MSAITKLYITHGSLDSAQSVDNAIKREDKRDFANAVINLFSRLASGARAGRVDLIIEDVTSGNRAAGSMTIDTHANITGGTDTVTIGTTTLTWEASPADENDIDVGADAAGDADNLAAAINAHSILSQIVSASSDGVDTVTITALEPGVIGEAITLAVSDATAMSAVAMTGVTGTLQQARTAYQFGQT